jgi:hypothetical protein
MKGLGGLPPRRPDQEYSPPPTVSLPGSASGVIRARQVIISGTNDGLFIYDGSPAKGNPPVLAAVAPGVTEDPYGNTVTSVLEIGNDGAASIQWDDDGNTYVSNSSNKVIIEIRPALQAMLFYSPEAGAGNLQIALASAAGTDQYGNTWDAGLTATQETISSTSIDLTGNATIDGTLTVGGNSSLAGDVSAGSLSTGILTASEAFVSGDVSCANLTTSTLTATSAASSINGASFPCAHVSNASGPSGDSQAAYNAAIYNTIVSLKAAGIMKQP